MRKDMKRKLFENGKYGGEGNTALRRNRRAAKQDPENAPRPAGMKALHRGRGWTEFKQSHPNMQPLYRWLNKQEGRSWDKVYSEVCEVVPAEHLYLIDNFVEQEVREIDGKLYDVSGGGNPSELRSFWSRGTYIDMYVDPRNGILRKTPAGEKYSRKEKDILRHPTNPLIQYHYVNGCLFEVTMRELTQAELYGPVGFHRVHWGYDYVNKTENRYIRDLIRDYGGNYFPASKRQLNSREIKRIKKMAA